MGAGGCCGGVGPKAFYPTLMTMPSLTPEAQRYIEVESSKRLGTGTEQITAGQMQLHGALGMSDGAGVQTAVTSVRQGLLLVESGASAQLAMSCVCDIHSCTSAAASSSDARAGKRLPVLPGITICRLCPIDW